MRINNMWVGCGRIANDLEIRINQKNKKMLPFAIAINEGTKENPYTTFVDIIAWEKYAETIKKYFQKGDQIIVGGRLQTYTVKDRGENRKRVSVILESFDFGQKKREKEEKNEEKIERTVEDLPFYEDSKLDYFGLDD